MAGADRRVRRRLPSAPSAVLCFYVLDAQAELAMRQTRLTALQRRRRARAWRPRAGCRSSRRRSRELEGRLESLQAVLPEEKDVADILRRLQTLATQSNLSIQRFTPQPIVQQTMYAEGRSAASRRARITTSGAFFDRISKFPRIINISRHLDQGEADSRRRGRDDHRRVRRDHVRAAGRDLAGKKRRRCPKQPSLAK